MCFGPEILLAAGLSVAGSALSAKEANKNAKRQQTAKDNAFRQELTRQQEFQKKSGETFDQTLAKFAPETQANDTAAITSARDASLQANIKDQSGDMNYAPVSEDAPTVVKSAIAKSLSEAVGKSRQEAKRLAALGATGQQMSNNGVAIGRAGTQIGTIGNFAGNSANVNRAEQNTAYQNAYRSPSGIGDLFSLAGQGLGIYGAMGGKLLPTELPRIPGSIGPMPSAPSIFG